MEARLDQPRRSIVRLCQPVRARPRSSPSTRSSTRTVTHGTRAQKASFWSPPESVTQTRECEASGVGPRIEAARTNRMASAPARAATVLYAGGRGTPFDVLASRRRAPRGSPQTGRIVGVLWFVQGDQPAVRGPRLPAVGIGASLRQSNCGSPTSCISPRTHSRRRCSAPSYETGSNSAETWSTRGGSPPPASACRTSGSRPRRGRAGSRPSRPRGRQPGSNSCRRTRHTLVRSSFRQRRAQSLGLIAVWLARLGGTDARLCAGRHVQLAHESPS